MSTQLQLQLQVNRYFTAIEAIKEVGVIKKDNKDDSEPHFNISNDDNDFN